MNAVRHRSVPPSAIATAARARVRLRALGILLPLLQSQACAPAAAPERLNISIDLTRPDWIAKDPVTDFGGIRILDNGDVIVADVAERAVRLLGRDGTLLRNIGRNGSGPGEYTRPTAVIALPGDSTLLLDRDARRYILLDPAGNVVSTRTFPTELGEGATRIAAADKFGNLFFLGDAPDVNGAPAQTAPIARWRRDATHFDTVATLQLNVPDAVPIALPEFPEASLRSIRRVTFGPNDDWLAARSGRIALIHANPYRVEWVERDGRRTIGPAVAFDPVPVTLADKRSREPDGPPFKRLYAEFKSSFRDGYAVADDADNLWVPRWGIAHAPRRRWDMFDAHASFVGSVELPTNIEIVAVTKSHVFVLRVDDDDQYWLQRHTRR